MLHLSPTPLTLWIGIIALILIGGLAVLAWRRSPHRGRSALLESLRCLAVLVVVILLWQPEWRTTLHPATKPRIAILWDDSKSMTTADAPLPLALSDNPAVVTRAEWVKKALAADLWKPLQADGANEIITQAFATPPGPAAATAIENADVTPESVLADEYGDFLVGVFDRWVREDVGKVHVMNFEWALAAWCQLPASVCLFAPRCGKALIVEHDGSLYSCDHFMYPEYRLGNIRDDDLAALVAAPRQEAFGAAKEATLPRYCLCCEFRFACHGECPKHRFL